MRRGQSFVVTTLAILTGSVGCIDYSGLEKDLDRVGRNPVAADGGDASAPSGDTASGLADASVDASLADAAGRDACVGESEAELRAANCPPGSCGGRTVRDSCGVQRDIDCAPTCATPPSTTCADGFTKREFPATGTCTSGMCVYPPNDTSCGAPTCTGGRATAAGTCSGAGVCTTGSTTTCAFGCSNTVCADDPCAGVGCTTPPAPNCKDSGTRRTFASAGTCAAGTCSYATTETACAAATCAAGVATAASICANGVCQTGAQTNCQWGCNNTVCAADPCLTTICNAPPAPDCANGTTRRTYVNAGTCSSATGSAVCTYAATNVACGAGETCWGGVCGPEVAGTTARMTGDGLDNCGPNGNDVCARSLLVTGGTFYRGTDTNFPATISDFRLDKYEVTVGRFRKFVDAWVGGWRPGAGAGKHTHLNAGAGLVNTAGGNEPGWDATWTGYVGAPPAGAVAPTGAGATTKADWDTNLRCQSPYQTWTSAAGANDKRPLNCLSWYDLHAFCIWDGGFLPSEAEWEYAAAGGSEERTYPWGTTAPAANAALAIYGCYYNGTGSCSGATNIAPVGTVAAGASKAGHLDLAGNVWEWTLDWRQSPLVVPCTNCTNLTASAKRVARGGSFWNTSGALVDRETSPNTADRMFEFGGRCARTPSGGTCTAETDAAFCSRLGATCGSKSGTDNCGNPKTVSSCGSCAAGQTCAASNTCTPPLSELTATTATVSGDGLSNCGSGTEPCARSLLVPGGTFGRGPDRDAVTTISDLRIDKYEVTVGRFRRFVDDWLAGWRPQTGSGKHSHVRGGLGLVDFGGGSNETGWRTEWTAYVGAPSSNAITPSAPGAVSRSNWDSVLTSCANPVTWAPTAGGSERKPQNCISWYDAYAFCIWDGGFLPTDAEWEYVAAGGSQGRTFPWGQQAPTAAYANFYSTPGVFGTVATVTDRPLGAARWNQADLAGNVYEWVIDATRASPPATCSDCYVRSDSDSRGVRGGCFGSSDYELAASFRTAQLSAATRDDATGARCARAP